MPHLFHWPSMPAVCCTARRAMYMGNAISWACHAVPDVFFQLPAQTSNRVEFGNSDTVIQPGLTYSSMDGIVS